MVKTLGTLLIALAMAAGSAPPTSAESARHVPKDLAPPSSALAVDGTHGFLQTADIDDVRRLGGSNRIRTSIALANEIHLTRDAQYVVVASADNFPDALSGGQLAASLASPLVLTWADRIDPDVLPAVANWGTNPEIVLMGGELALTADVERGFRDAGYVVSRVAGADRAQTAIEAARRAVQEMDAIGVPQEQREIWLADGYNQFQDPLIAASAASVPGVLLLTNGIEMPVPTMEYLDDERQGRPVIALGTAAREAFDEADELIGGDDPFANSLAVAQRNGPISAEFAVATGTQFADAVGGAAHAGFRDIPLLFSFQAGVPPETINAIAAASPDRVYIYGGRAAVDDVAANQLGQRDVALDCDFTACRMVFSRTATRALCDMVCDLQDESSAVVGAAAREACDLFPKSKPFAPICGFVAGQLTSNYIAQLQIATQEGSCFRQGGFYFIPLSAVLEIGNATVDSVNGESCDRASNRRHDLTVTAS